MRKLERLAVYPKMMHAVLEVKQRDVMFSLIYKNMERLFQQNWL
jgi:hypothetical protein